MSRILAGFLEDSYKEDWIKYDELYDETRKKNEIVDGISVEKFECIEKKNRLNSELKEEIYEEVDEENDIKQESDLDEISNLLNELNKLDEKLNQTSIEISSEKAKKQKNKKVIARKKIKKAIIQK